MAGEAEQFDVELLRAAPSLVDLVAQLFWVTAPQRRLGVGDVDEAGLAPLLADAPLSEGEAAALDKGLDALLGEVWAKEAGVYVREVSDVRGVRREVGVPVPPGEWSGAPTMVGPFAEVADAEAWRREHVGPPLVGDTITYEGRLYVDVFVGEGGEV